VAVVATGVVTTTAVFGTAATQGTKSSKNTPPVLADNDPEYQKLAVTAVRAGPSRLVMLPTVVCAVPAFSLAENPQTYTVLPVGGVTVTVALVVAEVADAMNGCAPFG
jgi:hypothetical protein